MSEGDYNRNSFRNGDVGESYDVAPRINSSHLRSTYSRLVHLTDNINFSSPIFDGMLKRNRSLGSTQAFICELALSDRKWVEEKLKPFCIGDGINILITSDYMDNVYFERLNAYKEKAKPKPIPAPSPTPTPKNNQKRLYYK